MVSPKERIMPPFIMRPLHLSIRGRARRRRRLKWDSIILVLVHGLALATVFHTFRRLNNIVNEPRTPSDSQELLPRYSDRSTSDQDSSQCRIYLAPSSIIAGPSNRPAGFGIFTTQPIPKGSYIFPRGTGPVIPITDLIEHNDNDRPPFAESIFMPKCTRMGIESDQLRNRTYLHKGNWCFKANSNCGSLTNYHPMLVNIMNEDTDYYQDNILSRFTDPGAGAFSYQTGERWHASRYVEAGEEIFLDYGEEWFFEGILLDKKKSIARKENYLTAATLIQLFLDAKKGSEIGGQELNWMRNRVAKCNCTTASEERLLMQISSDVNTFSKLVESSKSYASKSETGDQVWSLARSVGMQTNLQRDVGWIITNGRCLDNVYPKRSTLPQAGQGGFASRHLEKGQVIVPVPTMIQVTDREDFNMYKPNEDSPYTKQLLLNYCFGHDRSDIMICPSTNANLINHCSTRLKGPVGQCDPAKGPNAIVRWATDFDPETSDWLAQDIDTIEDRIEHGLRGLSLEVVALRDIRPSEEIFIDYGTSWERAWDSHVSSWRPPTDQVHVPVSDMNDNKERFLLTAEELKAGAEYPHMKVRIGCRIGGSYHPCGLRHRNNSTNYLVKARKFKNEGEDYGDCVYLWPFENSTALVDNVSTADIKFFAGHSSSDQHLEGTFRHHIELPGGMWPEQWMTSNN